MEVYDVLVLGSGIAGMVTAISLAEKGLSVLLVNKGNDTKDTNSYYAQGGIIYKSGRIKGSGGDRKSLRDDILKAGCYINNTEAVDVIVKEGARHVKNFLIDRAGVPFTGNKNGELCLTKEAAHSRERIIYAYDKTGEYIVKYLNKYLNKLKNIEVLNNHIAIDLLTREHHSRDPMRFYLPSLCLGAFLFDVDNRKVKKVLSFATILATGGMGQIFKYTTNPSVSTSDGFAMAYRAGAKLINMEFTQFHPTVFYQEDATSFLISETVRGEGGFLKNIDGKRFMKEYHPEGSLAPRDIVARAIHEEMLKSKERGKMADYVLLDLARIGSRKIKSRFPGIYSHCLKSGLDITREPIPVVPAFHFPCGGAKVDIYGMTNLDHLFAVGEVSCTGLHGANRLASTSLLEGLVWGKRCSDFIHQNWDRITKFEFPDISEWDDSNLTETVDPALINQDWEMIKNTMWNYVGLVRSKKRLRRAIGDLRHLQEMIEDFYRNNKLTKSLIELRNAVQTALSVTYSAWRNRESIGCHYRKD